ncbi:MAG: Gfo/Idh/MocA family oxidoreductase [Rhodothermia bacterium]|nr:MAG: Gfo/Idh/MocA family oxidoreductase [Rhodothermia bacterium]
MDAKNTSRREFIKKGTLAASAIVTGVTSQPVRAAKTRYTTTPSSVLGANSQLRVGFVGVGGQGFNAHVRTITNMTGEDNETWHTYEHNAAGVAACDLYSARRDRAGALLELARTERGLGDYKVETYEDHRRLVERDDIDVVFIGSVDHWHSQITIDALESGKHVYCEKPMTRYLPEAFEVYDAVKRTGMKFQVGSQYATEGKWHVAADMIRAGKIGRLVLAQDSYTRNSTTGEWNYYKLEEGVTPATLDWEHWLGKVSNRVAFNREHYHRWRKYLRYCAGILGDLLAHRIHPLVIATGDPEFPTRVACLGTNGITLEEVGPDDRTVTDNTQVIAEFPSGLAMVILGSTVNEQGLAQVIRGHEATLYFGGNTVELRPERPFADLVDPESQDNIEPGVSIPAHVANLFDSIRNDTSPNGNIDVAIRAQTIISMAEMSERLGEMVYFDEETRSMSTGSGRPLETLTYGTLELS